MIGGSTFLKSEVQKYVADWSALEATVGFPDAAVDRIVPLQHHEDPLFVQVEPFCEWVIQESGMKSSIHLQGVHYVADLEPYIERKLFSVNTGHAELEKRNMQPDHLYETIGMIFNYKDPEDEQSQQLQALLDEKSLPEVIAEITGLQDEDMIETIRQNIEKYAYVAA